MANIYIIVHRGYERVGDVWVSLGPSHHSLEQAQTTPSYEFNGYYPVARWREVSRSDRGPIFNTISTTTTQEVCVVGLEKVGS